MCYSYTGIPVFAILTKVDILCDKVKEDVTNTYKSVAVQNAVNKTHEFFGIPVYHFCKSLFINEQLSFYTF